MGWFLWFSQSNGAKKARKAVGGWNKTAAWWICSCKGANLSHLICTCPPTDWILCDSRMHGGWWTDSGRFLLFVNMYWKSQKEHNSRLNWVMPCSANMLPVLLGSKGDSLYECKLKEKYDVEIIFYFCRLHSAQKNVLVYIEYIGDVQLRSLRGIF